MTKRADCPHCNLIVSHGDNRTLIDNRWWHMACAKVKVPWAIDNGGTRTGRITSDRSSLSDIARSVEKSVARDRIMRERVMRKGVMDRLLEVPVYKISKEALEEIQTAGNTRGHVGGFLEPIPYSSELAKRLDAEDDNVLPSWSKTVPETPDIWFDWMQGFRFSVEHWNFEDCLKHAQCADLDPNFPVQIREHRVDEIFEIVEMSWDQWNRLTVIGSGLGQPRYPMRRCFGAGQSKR